MAESVLLRGAMKYGTNPAFHWALAQLYNHTGRLDEALDWATSCLRLDPESVPCFDALGLAMDDPSLATRVESALGALQTRSEMARSYLEAWKTLRGNKQRGTSSIQRWVASDLDTMVKTTQARGIPVMLQSYPQDTGMNAVIAQVAARRGLLFVNRQTAFQDLHDQGVPDLALFTADGHCNRDGYTLMAKNLAETLVSKGLLSKP